MISHITSQETWNGIRDGQDIVQMLEAFRIGGGGGNVISRLGHINKETTSASSSEVA